MAHRVLAPINFIRKSAILCSDAKVSSVYDHRRTMRELDPRVCVRNPHTAQFYCLRGVSRSSIADFPSRPLCCTIRTPQRWPTGGGNNIQEDSAMPDVQVAPNSETRVYLNIAETADRSRLAQKDSLQLDQSSTAWATGGHLPCRAESRHSLADL
jgi:hypothetical protein